MPRNEMVSVVTFDSKRSNRNREVVPDEDISPPPQAHQLPLPPFTRPPIALPSHTESDLLAPLPKPPWYKRHSFTIFAVVAIVCYQGRAFLDQQGIVNTTALVVHTDSVVTKVALALSRIAVWGEGVCVYINAERQNCTAMLRSAHEYAHSRYFDVQPELLDIDTGMFWGFWERSGKKAQNRQVSIPSEGEGVPRVWKCLGSFIGSFMEMSRKFHWKFHGDFCKNPKMEIRRFMSCGRRFMGDSWKCLGNVSGTCADGRAPVGSPPRSKRTRVGSTA